MQPNTKPATGTDQQGNAAVQLRSHMTQEQGAFYTAENRLLFVKQGAMTLLYGKKEYAVHENQVAFLKKDILVAYQAGLETGRYEKVEYIMVCLNDALIREFTKTAALPGTATEQVAVIVEAPGTQTLHCMHSLEAYLAESAGWGSGFMKLKLMELLFCLANANVSILQQLLQLQAHYKPNITATVEENMMNALSLRQLAVLSGRSLSSFRRDFQATYNMSPSEWIRRKRLEKARELLTTTPMSVTDICYTLGFESIAHFSRLFKAYYKDCPSKFRVNYLPA